MELDELAGRVSRLGAEVSGAGAALGRADAGAGAFLGDGPGALFALGRTLHADWTAALSAREREAAAHGARLTDLGTRLRWAADGYRETETGVHRRHQAQDGSDPLAGHQGWDQGYGGGQGHGHQVRAE